MYVAESFFREIKIKRLVEEKNVSENVMQKSTRKKEVHTNIRPLLGKRKSRGKDAMLMNDGSR